MAPSSFTLYQQIKNPEVAGQREMAASTAMEDLAHLNLNSGKRLTRCSNLRNASTAKAAIQSIMEAESRCRSSSSSSSARRVDGEGSSAGARQVKLVIRKRELKQMAASMGWVRLHAGDRKFMSAAGLERFFNALKAKQLRRCRWEPALRCIPEES